METEVLEDLSKISEDERERGIKLLLKIFNNIIQQPNDQKYHDINLKTVCDKLNNNPLFLGLLFNAGFDSNQNGDRLLFDIDNMHQLKLIHNSLLLFLSHNKTNNHHNNVNNNKSPNNSAITELINYGFTEHEAKSAIDISKKQNTERLQPIMDMNESGVTDLTNQNPIQQLISMGFTQQYALIALEMSENGIDGAVEILTMPQFQDCCDEAMQALHQNQPERLLHDVRTCPHVYQLCKIMKEQNIDNTNIVSILDSFHHALSEHSRHCEDFDYIYNKGGGHCNAKDCESVRRLHQNRSNMIDIGHQSPYDSKLRILNIEEIFDTIHYHFRHGYDIGSRVSPVERTLIDEIKENNLQIRQTINILQKKRTEFEKCTNNTSKYSISNKFSSNLCQLNINQTAKNDDDSKTSIDTVPVYSFSLPFNYFKKCKNDDKCRHLNLTYSALYVRPKHSSLKEEVLNNKIYKIDMVSWDFCLDKASCLIQTRNAKRSKAETNKYDRKYQFLKDHPTKFGYIDGTSITKNHLMVLYIYCAFDNFQRKFTETYRKLRVQETLKDIVDRHSNFHHFAKNMNEAINVFGIRYFDGIIKRLYHGIDRQMIFSSFSTIIYSPLSTTYDWNVAVQFSNDTGIVVELVPSMNTKYFECEWISPFSNEGELLFINGMQGMNFVNMINTEYGIDYNEYITALRIIDTMTNGSYFMPDPANIHRMKRPNGYMDYGVAINKLSNITINDKRLCLALIDHELNKNKCTLKKCLKLPHLNDFVDILLHQMCLSKQNIKINWTAMDNDVLKKCDAWSGMGYIGYRFMKTLFCNENYEGIDLNLINALLPNLLLIEMHELSIIDTAFMNDIYNFIKNNKNSKIYYFALYIKKELEFSNILEQINEFKGTYEKIGWTVYFMEDRAEKQNKVVITKDNASKNTAEFS